MAKQRSPKGAQSSQKPPMSKASGYHVSDSKNSGKSSSLSQSVGVHRATDPTKHGSASVLRQATDRKVADIIMQPGHALTQAISTRREGEIPVRLLSAKDPRATDVAARVELRRMVEQIPAEKLQQAIEVLKTILAPGPAVSPVVAASDAEVTAAADQFIRQYKPALNRLAKR